MIKTHPVSSTNSPLVLLGFESTLILIQTNRLRNCVFSMEESEFPELVTLTF